MRRTTILLLTVLTAASLFLSMARGDADARPTGRRGPTLRVLEASDAPDPFSPANQDGRFDVNNLHVTFAVGPVSRGGVVPRAGGPPIDLIRDSRSHRHVVVRMRYAVSSPGGRHVFAARRNLEFRAPLVIVDLPMPGGGAAPFALISADLAWDGRDRSGGFATDGTYAYLVTADLYTYVGAAHGHGAPLACPPDRGAVLAEAEPSAGAIAVDNTPPDVVLDFPPPESLTDANRLAVRGHASDTSGVAAVSLNGAAVSGDAALSRWRSSIALSRGSNTLSLEAEDAVGNRTGVRPVARVKSEAELPISLTDIEVDSVNGRALVVDSYAQSILTVDLATGERSRVASLPPSTGHLKIDPRDGHILVFSIFSGLSDLDPITGALSLISGAARGSGPLWNASAGDFVIDTERNRALLGAYDDQFAPASIFAIDLATGDRTILSSESTGLGPFFSSPVSAALDAAHGRMLVSANVTASWADRALFAIDLATGDRTLLADLGGSSFDLEVDAARDRVYGAISVPSETGTRPTGQIFALDLTTAAKTVISGPTRGAGPELQTVLGLAIDSEHGRVLATSEEVGGVFAVSLSTGDRSFISGGGVGPGPVLVIPTHIQADPSGRGFYVVDVGWNALMEVDASTGERRIVSDDRHGGGVSLAMLPYSSGFAVDAARRRALLVNRYPAALLSVDLATGDRTTVSGADVGGGPVLTGSENDVAFDPAANRAIVSYVPPPNSPESVLLSIDLGSGDRTVLSGDTAGSGPRLYRFVSLALDPANGRLLATERHRDSGSSLVGGLFSIVLATGDRAIVSDGSRGGGPPLITPGDLVVDSARHRVLLTERSPWSVVAVDLDTGDRTVISGGGVGEGPTLRGLMIDLALEPRAGVVWLPGSFRAIYAVDVESGDRVIASQ